VVGASPFARRRSADCGEVSAKIKAWARERFALPEQTSVTVSEIVCRDPACPGVETVILIMDAGMKTRMVRIARPMTAVTVADIWRSEIG
jgi:hypothetical protein